MSSMKFFVAVGLAAVCLMASVALADEASGAAAKPPTVSPEEGSLLGFGLQNVSCLEWSDNCSVCLRDEKDAAHCSTPGIACQPVAIACRREKAK
jgi:hypothetical protein